MLNTKTKNRILIFLSIFAISIILTIFLLKTLRNNVLYFYSPSEVSKSDENSFKNNIRLGGMVKPGSVETDNNEIKFIVTDYEKEIIVIYQGTVPALFAEGKGVVAEGKLQDKKFFLAKRILAKHDENYMPPELKESMKQNAK